MSYRNAVWTTIVFVLAFVIAVAIGGHKERMPTITETVCVTYAPDNPQPLPVNCTP